MPYSTFVLPDELGAIVNEFSKPVTRVFMENNRYTQRPCVANQLCVCCLSQ